MTAQTLTSLVIGVMAVAFGASALHAARGHARPLEASGEPDQDPIVIEAGPTDRAGCTTAVSHTLSAAEIDACETVEVVTRAQVACRACPGDVNVVLIRTKWIPTLRGQLDRVGEGVIDELIKRRDESGVKAGVAIVYYDSETARVALPLTDDLERARSAFASTPTGVGGYGGYERGAALGLDVLKSAAERGEPRCDLIVFFGLAKEHAVGEYWEGLRLELLRAGASMRRDDSTLLTYCIHLERDCPTMKAIASSPRFYAEVPDVSKLSSATRSVTSDYVESSPAGLDSLGLDLALPASIGLVAGSASPPPAEVVTEPLATTVRWRWDTPMDAAGVAITYTLRPADPGVTGAFTITGSADVDPRSGERRTVPVPSIPIRVADPCAPPPSPTPPATEPPPPTETEAPSPPTATATIAPSATPLPLALYLPIALDEAPCTRQQRSDVVVVLDASSSMQDPAGDGRTKLEAARAGAAAFVERLKLEDGDQAALVQFNRTASVLAELTNDRAVLTAALGAMTTDSETCLVCGLEAAGAVLDGDGRRSDNQPIVILMTDGRSNPRPVSEAVAAAARLEARGIAIFTIGFGSDLDEAALVEIASRPAFAFRALDGAALEAIFRELAVTLPGPADCYWGRRG